MYLAMEWYDLVEFVNGTIEIVNICICYWVFFIGFIIENYHARVVSHNYDQYLNVLPYI